VGATQEHPCTSPSLFLSFSLLYFVLQLSPRIAVVSAAQTPATAPQKKPDAPASGPSDAKAKKTFNDAIARWQNADDGKPVRESRSNRLLGHLVWSVPRGAAAHSTNRKKFDGQPFIALSISLDDDEAKWKDFVGKNGMTWPQYRDGGFTGRIATQFAVTAILATFTIDADGVLEDQHVCDADIEGKLKKLIARAVEMNNRKLESVAPQTAN
jgi:hypothetical protein